MKITIEYDDGLPFASHELGADDADAWLALFENTPAMSTGFVGTAADASAREFAESLVGAARAAKRNLEAGPPSRTAEAASPEGPGDRPSSDPAPRLPGEPQPASADFEGIGTSLGHRAVAAVLGHGRRLVQGAYGLAVTYWGFGFGVSAAVYAFVALLLAGELLGLSRAVLGIHFMYCLLVWTGIWTAANHYSGSRAWRRLAKSSVVVIAVLALALLATILGENA